MKKYLAICVSLVLCSCRGGNGDYDATGMFEATEVTVSAEESGRIVALDVTEGDTLTLGRQVGLVDTVQLYLKALELGATRESYAAQRPDIPLQIASTKRQLAKAELDLKRYEALYRDGAGNKKQADDAASQVDVIRRELSALESSLEKSTGTLNSQMGAAGIQRAQVLDRLARCRVRAPLDGVVLEKYAEAGEYAVPGTPLFKMADTKDMYLRAYVTTAQLEKVRTGQGVTLWADYGNGNRRRYEGTVAWISDRSEFTPKTVLTDDERADLVYAVKILVRNDGFIKIGMYGEVKF